MNLLYDDPGVPTNNTFSTAKAPLDIVNVVTVSKLDANSNVEF